MGKYKTFEELPDEIKNRFCNEGRPCSISRKQKIFLNFINSLDENGDELIDGIYTRNSSKLKIKWHDCGHVTEICYANYRGGRRCGVCYGSVIQKGINDIATTHPHIIQYLVNSEDAYTHRQHSGDYVEVCCPDCGTHKKMRISHLINNGIMCTQCGDGISYPEKFVGLLLQQLGIKYETQFKFDGYKYRYDIITNDKCLIEVHGIQHYEDSFDKYEQQHNIDLAKYDLAVLNGYEYDKTYFVVDARYSDLEWMKQHIKECKFFKQFDLTNINWTEIDKNAHKSKRVEVVQYWNEKTKDDPTYTVGHLIEYFGIGRQTAIRYLHWGNELGLCSYNPDIDGRKRKKQTKKQKPRSEETRRKMSEAQKGRPSKQQKSVICLETLQVFDNATKAGEWCGVGRTSISNHLNGGTKSAGKHPLTNKKLHWMHYEDYLKQQNSDNSDSTTNVA